GRGSVEAVGWCETFMFFGNHENPENPEILSISSIWNAIAPFHKFPCVTACLNALRSTIDETDQL
ncbi:MAG: hypothetical protein WEB60_04925, partial [Terrimicrobiaceae bacterium]